MKWVLLGGLSEVVRGILPIDKVIVRGDLNGHSGTTSRAMTMCLEALVWEINMKEEFHFWIWQKVELVIANLSFQKKKITWLPSGVC